MHVIIKKDRQIDFFVWVMVVIAASLPLFGLVIYSLGLNHDTFFHTQRILSIKNALADGQFPVRIYKEIFDGYGYGAPLFYPELFLYFPAILCLLGLPIVVSYNLFLLVVNIATLVSAIYSFSNITKSKEIGLISAILYELSIYRLVDLYTRASMGEFLALVFCPLVLCGLVQITRGEVKKWWVLALGMSGVLQSHILTFVIMVIVCVVYVVCNIKRFFHLTITKVCALTKATFITVGINLWFLIPFLQVSGMKVNAIVGTENFWETEAAVLQLFDVLLLGATGIETYGEGVASSLPKTPGIPILLGCVLFLIMILTENIYKKIPKQVYGFLIAGFVSVCMLTNFFPWKLIKKVGILKNFFEKFQFMWRFNILVILFLSIVAAYGYWIYLRKRRETKEVIVIICLGLCMYSFVYTNQFVKNAGEYNETLTIETGYMDQLYLISGNNIFEREDLESNAESITYEMVEYGNAELSFVYKVGENEAVQNGDYYIDVPIAYYPGYVAYVDGERVKTECSTGGVVRIHLPEKKFEGTVRVEYVESTLYLLGDVVSLLCIIAILILCVKKIVSGKTRGNLGIPHNIAYTDTECKEKRKGEMNVYKKYT